VAKIAEAKIKDLAYMKKLAVKEAENNRLKAAAAKEAKEKAEK